MKLLIQAVVLLLLVGIPASISTWQIGRSRQLSKSIIVLLIAAPVVDSIIAYWLFNWFGISGATLWIGSLCIGIISHVLAQPLLVSERLVVWRLAKENILRRKRQAALLMAGLVIASAIITSSLVVGDSLDATIIQEVEGSWGETDITLSGFDLSTGERVVISESIANKVWQDINIDATLSKQVNGQQQGIISGVSIAASSGKSLPAVTWAAMNSTIDNEQIWPKLGGSSGIRFIDLAEVNLISTKPNIAVNQVLAEELELTEGDEVEIGWYITEDNARKRIEESFIVHKIVNNAGMANLAGTKSPALFSDLLTAQDLQNMPNEINTVYYAIDSKYDAEGEIEPVINDLGVLLNNTLTAEDVGFSLDFQSESESLTISSNQGLGRIKGDDVSALRENLSTLLPGANMLEVLQVPLIELEYQNEQILTLASNEIDDIQIGNRSLWHFADGGFGHQVNGDGKAWLWQTKADERINGHAFSDSGEFAAVAHSSGLVVGSENDLDSDVWAEFDSDGEMEAIAHGEQDWWAVEHYESNLSLYQFSENLASHTSNILSMQLPSTILSIDLQVEDYLYLSIEGLLSVERYVSNNLSSDATFTAWQSGDYWPSEDPIVPIGNHACNGLAVVESDNLGNWCTYEQGLLRYEANNIETIRLPVLSSAGGFGDLPQLFLAFGGGDSPIVVEGSNVAVSNRLSPLDMQAGLSNLWVKGLIPYAFGNDSALRLTHDGEYSQLAGLESLADLDDVVLGFISLDYGEQLSASGDDERSILILAGGDLDSNDDAITDAAIANLTAWFDERSDSEDINLQFTAVKVEAAKAAAQSSGVISGMFLVFGTFTIAAGVLLVLTIVLMLAESRRSELGVMRAIGVTRSDARALAVMEGVVIAAVSGVIGSLIGLLLAMGISAGFSSIFASAGSDLFTFAWEFNSLFAGWAWGFLLAMLTLWSTALWTSRLNIVAALRGGMQRVQSGLPWPLLLFQICTLAGAVLALLVLIILGFDSPFGYLLWTMGGVFVIATLTPIFTWELPIIMRKNGGIWDKLARHASRNTFAWLGSLLLVWTILLAGIDPVRSDMTPDEFSFILLGLVEVFAGVMVLTSLAPMIVSRLGRSKMLTKRMGPTVPVALAHPLASPVRTAVVMAMFSITVFSVVVLSGYTEQFDNYSSSFVEETEGEFELMLTSSRSRPIELDSDPANWNINSSLVDDIDATGLVYRSEVFLEDANEERMPYILRGYDGGFANHGGLPLFEWDSQYGSTESEVWNTVRNRQDLVLLDASFGLELATDGTGISTLSFSIGDSIFLIDLSNPGNKRFVTVAGFLEQSSYLFSPGVWMSDEIVEEQFDGRLTRMYVSLSDSATASSDFDESGISTFSATGKPSNVRIAAAQLAEELEDELNKEGVTISVISDDVMLIQSLVIAILGIFEAYLALGLIVGIGGIGVVTVRSVSERRRTIGILRALGYRKSMVMLSFLIEVSWVAVLGIINGVMIAVGFHRALYVAFWEEQGAAFSLPWSTIAAVVFGGWILVILATAVPIRRATKVPPSAALREA